MQDKKPIIISKARFRAIIWGHGAVSGHTSISVHRILNLNFVLCLLTNLTQLFHSFFTPARSLRSMMFYTGQLLINCFKIKASTIRWNFDIMHLKVLHKSHPVVWKWQDVHSRESTFTLQIQSVKKIIIVIND